MRTFCLLLCVCFPFFTKAENEARFATVFTNNMVLQQTSTVNVWGYARPFEKIVLHFSWTKTDEQVTADAAGKWTVKVKTPKAGFTPQSIALKSSASKTVILKNILIGEVWLCSGQSNMEMVLQDMPEWNLRVENSAAEIACADYPYIRCLTVGRKESFVPQPEIYSQGWKICTPQNVKWFSAVAYFFAKKIYQRMHLPVGLVVSSYGGSPVQSWLPEATVCGSELYAKENAEREAERKASAQSEAEYIQSMSEWIKTSEAKAMPVPASETCLNLPVNLEKSKVGNQLGEVQFVRNIVLPDSLYGKELQISLGRMDDMGRVYFNGELVWQEVRNSHSYSDIQFVVPASKVKIGENRIEVRVLNVLWGGGLTGPADKMYYVIGANGVKQSLAGDWQYTKNFDLSQTVAIPREGKPLFSTVSSLYNGMIFPLLDFTFKGCLWYQGEGNVGDKRYAEMFSDMIGAWRENFKQELPFFFVQIAPYNHGDAQGQQSVLTRELQAETAAKIPHAYMAVTIDIGEADNIHPAKKKEVGERLAALALCHTYGQTVACLYPQVQKAVVENDSVVIYLKNIYKGIELRGDQHALELSEDGVDYFPASVRASSNRLTATCRQSMRPKFVRYCWHNVSKGTIFNSEGLSLNAFKVEIQQSK
jgi:sialate O-acetylesterase